MDMQLNKEILKSEREKRAWSQSHLADVAGLSLRTVQRIERTGAASLDSAKALASAFDVTIEQLNFSVARSNASLRLEKVSMLTAICASALLVFTWWGSAMAEPIMLDLSVTANDQTMADVQLLNEKGEQSELQIDGMLKLLVIPTSANGKILLSARIYEYTNNQYILKAEPQLLTSNHEVAEINFNSEQGTSYKLLIEPHL